METNFDKFPKDILVTLALELDLPDIVTYCRLSKRFNNIVCNNYSFWYNKLRQDYGFIYNGEKTLDEIKKYYRKIKNMESDVRMREASKLGNKIAIDKAIQKGADNWNWSMEGAARGGHKELVVFFIEKGANSWDWGMFGAAVGGHKDLVDFFIEKGANNWNDGMYSAALGGHKDLVDFFIQKGADSWDISMEAAAKGKHKDLVDFFKSKMNN